MPVLPCLPEINFDAIVGSAHALEECRAAVQWAFPGSPLGARFCVRCRDHNGEKHVVFDFKELRALLGRCVSQCHTIYTYNLSNS